MSILIPGKMPTSCARCPCANDETPFCRATNKYIPMLGKPEWCPIIELPPHGRLIDADALLADHGLGTYCPECKRDERSCQFEMIHTTMDFCGWIEDAPTIVPAEGE